MFEIGKQVMDKEFERIGTIKRKDEEDNSYLVSFPNGDVQYIAEDWLEEVKE